MRLVRPEPGDGCFNLVMSPVEWREVYALARFAQAAIAYDSRAAYVAQVFVYIVSRPQEILGNTNAHAAFAAVDRLRSDVSENAVDRDVI